MAQPTSSVQVQPGVAFQLTQYNTYIYPSSTISLSQATVYQDHVYLSSVVAGTSTLNFGLGATDTNLTITSITATGITFSLSNPTSLTHVFFYYDPSNSPVAVKLGSSTTIYAGDFSLTPCTTNNCVYVNPSQKYIEIVADPSSESVLYFSTGNACLVNQQIGSSISSEFLLLVVLPLVLAAGAIIFFLQRFGQMTTGSVIPIVIIIAVSILLVIGFVLLSSTTNILSTVLGC